MTNPTASDLGPLDWRIAITDNGGRPTPEFQRRWNTQRTNNGLIGTALGEGAPTVDPTPKDGQEYVDTSTTPWTLYVAKDGTWTKVGVYKFTELSDVPHNYTSSGSKLVRVNPGATALEFTTVSSALDGIGAVQGDILYRNATNWTVLPPGTAGNLLTTGGAGANPSWSPAAATGVTSVGLTSSDITVGGATSPITSSGTYTLTLATVNSNVGSFGDSTHIPTFTVNAKGLITAASQSSITVPIADNPTATASDIAVNGSATTFMRSDGAPAVQKATSGQFGVVKVDGTTITSSSGVISSTGSGITQLTGDVLAGPGSGSQVATLKTSVTLPGSPVTTTQSQGDNSTKVATTAYTDGAISTAIPNPTNHGIVLGKGTSVLNSLGAATNGQIPIGSTGSDPVLSTITAGAGVTITNSAGGISIAAVGSAGTGAMVWLASSSPTGTGVVTFTLSGLTIPAGVGSLLITGMGRGTAAIANVVVELTFNNDTSTAKYQNSRIYANANTANGASDTADGYINIADISGGTAPSGQSTAFQATIFDYANTAFTKTTLGQYNLRNGSSNINNLFSFNTAGFWGDSSAITVITLTLSSGNWATGSRISLYGIIQ